VTATWPGQDLSDGHLAGSFATGDAPVDWSSVDATVVDGSARTGELYDYSAQFGDYQVIVIANPLVIPEQPVAHAHVDPVRREPHANAPCAREVSRPAPRLSSRDARCPWARPESF